MLLSAGALTHSTARSAWLQCSRTVGTVDNRHFCRELGPGPSSCALPKRQRFLASANSKHAYVKSFGHARARVGESAGTKAASSTISCGTTRSWRHATMKPSKKVTTNCRATDLFRLALLANDYNFNIGRQIGQTKVTDVPSGVEFVTIIPPIFLASWSRICDPTPRADNVHPMPLSETMHSEDPDLLKNSTLTKRSHRLLKACFAAFITSSEMMRLNPSHHSAGLLSSSTRTSQLTPCGANTASDNASHKCSICVLTEIRVPTVPTVSNRCSLPNATILAS
jgi:hypothetical protein